MRFLISSEREGLAHCVYVGGEVDLATGPDLRKAMEDVRQASESERLIVDLSDVTFLDCAGIGVLVYGRHLAQQHGLGYEIRNATGMPLLLLQMTGVLGLES
jgi:anti-sigma B factor antagonist